MPDKHFDNDPEQFRFLQDGAVSPPDASRLWNKLEEQLDWAEQVRAQVGAASHTPPPQVWSAIESELDGRKKPVFVLWHKIAASLLLFLLLGGVGSYYFFDLGERNSGVNSSLSEKEEIQENTTSEATEHPEVRKTPFESGESLNLLQDTPPTPPTDENATLSSSSADDKPTQQVLPVPSGNTDQTTARENLSLLVPLEYIYGPVGSPKLFKLKKRPATIDSEAEEPRDEKKRWFIWLEAGAGEFRPNYSGDFGARSVGVRPADGDNLREVLTGNVVGTTRSYGGTFGRSLGKRWLLMSGLHYIRSNYTVHNTFYRDISSSDLQSGSFRVDYESQFQHQQEWLSVPLAVGYRVGGNKRLDAILQGGLSADWMFSEDRIDIYPAYHYEMGQTDGLHLNALLGVQLRYALLSSRRLYLVASGRYESTLGSQLEVPDVRRSPERYQFGLGMQWAF